MRIFVGLDIPSEIRDRIASFQEKMRALSPNEKWVSPESFHVTIKFMGEQPTDMVEQLKRTLAELKMPGPQVSFHDHGFFPSGRAPRVFWIGIFADEHLPRLVKVVDDITASFGVKREEHEYRPHLTLARSGSGAPRRTAEKSSAGLKALAEKLIPSSAPDFGSMKAQKFYLYESHLSPQGAKYTKIAEFGLL